MNILEIRLADLSSLDRADMTSTTRQFVGTDWLVQEIDHDRDIHIPLDMVSVGLGSIQCALAGIAIWVQARQPRDKGESKKIRATVRNVAHSSKVSAKDVALILAALDSDAAKLNIIFEGYRITVKRRRRSLYEVVGKRRKTS
jgi:hypothetical protein